jgi:hypothetical protein
VITRCFRRSKFAAFLILFAALPALVSRGAPNISPLGNAPDWQSLERFQETITRDDFTRLLQTVYCTRGVPDNLIKVEAATASILIDKDEQKFFTLRFAADPMTAKAPPRDWRAVAALRPAPPDRPLEGLKIAIDPGHIGGSWARMEERWFQVGDSKPVQEGDMTLLVAKILSLDLEKLGAKAALVRRENEPVTTKRPADLADVSRQILRRAGHNNPRDDFSGPDDPAKDKTIRWQNEILFYRYSEIRARAELVNEKIKPDVVLCLHFNAEAWDDPKKPTLIDRNHLHLLVNGSYLPPELEFDDVRFEMIQRLLTRTSDEEIPLAEKLAESMARHTQLPAYQYTTDNVAKVGATGYVYARNLIANRLYQAPVMYFEPYVMNSDEVFWRVQEGDYQGIRNVNGTDRPSIFREYAASIVDGLVAYYREQRRDTTAPDGR